MRITTIGIDIGKTWFHLVGCSADGAIVIRRRCPRRQLVTYVRRFHRTWSGWQRAAARIISVEL